MLLEAHYLSDFCSPSIRFFFPLIAHSHKCQIQYYKHRKLELHNIVFLFESHVFVLIRGFSGKINAYFARSHHQIVH